MVQVKDTMNKNQSLPCWSWWHGPLFFLRQFLRLVLLLLLYHSCKIAIPHYHLFLLLQVLHLVLFKSLQRQGELSISGYIRVLLWWARYDSRRLSFLKRADLTFLERICWNLFLTYFRPSVSKSCPPGAATMRRLLRCYWWQVNTFWDIRMCHWPRRCCAM